MCEATSVGALQHPLRGIRNSSLMSRSTSVIGRDRGLQARMLLTMFLLGALYVVFMAVLAVDDILVHEWQEIVEKIVAVLLDQVIKVHVPTPVALAETPTLAEVRWIRKVPFSASGSEASFFVGLKFLFSAGR